LEREFAELLEEMGDVVRLGPVNEREKRLPLLCPTGDAGRGEGAEVAWPKEFLVAAAVGLGVVVAFWPPRKKLMDDRDEAVTGVAVEGRCCIL